MRLSLFCIAASALSLAGLSAARITGFSAPTTPIKAGDTFDVTFTTENYITNNEQYYALFGLTSRQNIGNTIGSAPIANVDISSYPKGHGSFSVPITLGTPASSDSTQYLATAVFGEVGASGGITVQYFNATINYQAS